MADKREVLRKVQNGVLYTDGTIRLDNCRASHPHLIEPYAGKDENGKPQKPAYSIGFLMPKRTHEAIRKICMQRIAEVLKENKTAKLADDRIFLRDGDSKAKAEMEGMWLIGAREARPPILRTPSKERIVRGKTQTVTVSGKEVPLKELFYGGCYVNGIIRPWWQSNDFGKRVNAGLVAVQFLKDGEAFGEQRVTEDEIDDSFDQLEDPEDSGFDDDGESEETESELIGGL